MRDLHSWSAEQIRDRVVFNAEELIDVMPLNAPLIKYRAVQVGLVATETAWALRRLRLC